MKVALLNTYTEGGAAEAALRLHAALREHAVQSKFVALYKGRCDAPEVYDFRKELPFIDYWTTKLRNKGRMMAAQRITAQAGELFSDIRTVWDVAKHSAVKEADVVHLHWVSGFADLPSFFGSGKKAVWTLHDQFPFSGGFHYPPPHSVASVQQKIEEQKRTVKDIFQKHPIDFVSPSAYISDAAMASGLLEGCRFHVIKNPVDTALFTLRPKEEIRRQLNIPGFKKVILFLSDHIHYHRKGYQLLEKALELMQHHVLLLVAGRGDLPAIVGKAETQQFGLVRDKTLLAELYSCADLLVNPSRYDNSPNTIVEAMACGLPAVAFKTGGIPELITTTNGLLADEQTPQALARALDAALESDFDAAAIRSQAMSGHGYDVVAAQYKRVYEG